MGLTIHFRGYLRNPKAYDHVISIGREFAMKKNAEIAVLDSNDIELIRVKNGEIDQYRGQVRGMGFCLHPCSETILLQFDIDYYLSQFCKTQYAGIDTHLEVIQLLREIEPYFEKLNVVDEGGFWETSDLKILQERFGVSSQQTTQ